MTPPLLLLLLLLLLSPPISTATTTPLYLPQPTLFTSNYHHMLSAFKIFIYPQSPFNTHNYNFTSPPSFSLFHHSLLNSPFITKDPTKAHLFFLPFPPQSTRSLARAIHRLRTSSPFWDRSLGADHFFLSCNHVMGPINSRNVLELWKNAIQVTCFPSNGRGFDFVPHKDISLPPHTLLPPRALDDVYPTRRVGYWKRRNVKNSDNNLINSLSDDPEFLIESEPLDEMVYIEKVKTSKFCLFEYDDDVAGLGVALAYGCVPVVITDRPVKEFPLMDVIRWSEIALFVESRVGHVRLKEIMESTCEGGGYEKRRRLGVMAVHHLTWNEAPQPYDAFHMVMYQLWIRRHAIRYAMWDEESVANV